MKRNGSVYEPKRGGQLEKEVATNVGRPGGRKAKALTLDSHVPLLDTPVPLLLATPRMTDTGIHTPSSCQALKETT